MLDHTKFITGLIAFCDKDCNPQLNLDGKCNGSCFQICPRICKHLCIDGNLFPPLPVTQPIPKPRPLLVPQSPPLILPNPLYRAGYESQKHIITTSLIIMGSLIGVAILVCFIATIFSVKRRFSTRSRNQPPVFFGTQEDFLDEDQGPQIDHPIWYINTIGLQQSVIDSIAIFKYSKDEGLIEGTECSVCLNEFQEDENLRLLPKCSHAFHLPCIDTWLRSHKNCPLCRAPIIVSNNFDVRVESPVLTTTSSENSTSNQDGEDGSSEEGHHGDDMNVHTLLIEDETNGENSKTGSNFVSRNHFRVQSDLVGSRQAVETEMQPMRRSASLDLSSAMAIYNSVANQENLVQLKHSKSKNVSKRGSNGSISFRKMMQSSSIGHALQKAPISMKRSFSSSGRKSSSSSSRHSRSQDSILPV